MAERARHLDPTKIEPQRLDMVESEYLLKFAQRNGTPKPHLPKIPEEIDNYKKLFKYGIVQFFANELENIDQRLDACFTDDFSKIYLVDRQKSRKETLLSAELFNETGNGPLVIKAIVRSEMLPLVSRSESGMNCLRFALQGVLASSGYKYNNPKKV